MTNRWLVLLLVLVSVLSIIVAVRNPNIAWRLQIVSHKASGQMNDLSWFELFSMIRPGSPFYLRGLAGNPNPFAVIRNPYTSPDDLAQGDALFRTHCGGCHGLDGRGGHGPDLVTRDLSSGASDWAIFRTTQRGIAGTAMVPINVEDSERWKIIGHITALRNVRTDDRSHVDGARVDIALSSDRLEHAADEPGNWATYSGTYNSWRHSSLDQINSQNVHGLKLAWALQMDVPESIEATPIVIDGTMFMSVPQSDVLAIDAASGRTIWTYRRPIPEDVRACCGRVNRGVAVYGDRVFIGTLDAHLVALDARTGNVVWDVEVESYRKGYSITAAPLVARAKVIVGVSGGEYGIRGFLDAYDATTGARTWRFNTIPAPGEFGSDTWQGDSWKDGGGPTWVTGSFDSSLSLLYWGIGNPSPDFNGSTRLGDNLFTNSAVALDIETGKRRWHFQFTPHDEHDWDSNQVPVLLDHSINGTIRTLLLWANRNGFFYVLDRNSGALVAVRPFAKQNWAKEIDDQGRPVLSEFGVPTETGTLTWPGVSGATNWWSPSYSPDMDLFYVSFIESPTIFLRGSGDAEVPDGEMRLGGGTMHKDIVQTGVRALSPTTGDLVWEHKMPPRMGAGQIGGVLSTGGNLVFVGDFETFYAIDASNGRELWEVNLGGRINATPIAFQAGGREFIAIAAGKALFVFTGPDA